LEGRTERRKTGSGRRKGRVEGEMGGIGAFQQMCNEMIFQKVRETQMVRQRDQRE
jgi:hypothetical protein